MNSDVTILDEAVRRNSTIDGNESSKTIKEPLIHSKIKSNDGIKAKSLPVNQYSFFDMFMFATKFDVLLMIVGVLASMLNGCTMPFYLIIFGSMTNSISADSDLSSTARKYAIIYLLIGAAAFIFSYIGLSCWMITGERQSLRYRKEYFRALLRQDVSWYDSQNINEFSTKIANDTQAIQGALSEKVSTFFYVLTISIGGFAVGFYKGWKLALILTASIIPCVAAVSFYAFSIQNSEKNTKKAYEKSGGYAEQALNAIKTVVGLSGEERELNRYTTALQITKKVAIKYGIMAGLSLGFVFGVIFANYALGFYAGSRFIESDPGTYDTGVVLTVFFAVTTGMMTVGQLAPCIKAFAAGKEAFSRVIEVIKKKPIINIEESHKGKKLESLTGDIALNDVEFAYPSRDHLPVLKKVNLFFEHNKKTAIVGESGCGKSTCMQLIERFYDVQSGSITVDGVNLKDLNLRWWRENVGYVGQEPALFATTIKENLLFAKHDASMIEIEQAAKQANAYEFIMSLEKKFETFVGAGGAQLSGGQKQRIAIARAILKNPKILLLDEATSALDRKNEIEIQETLDKISQGRTTIVIAHRLSTIQNSDRIIVLDDGQVVEEGTHDTLIAFGKVYPKIQSTQLLANNVKDSSPELENGFENMQNTDNRSHEKNGLTFKESVYRRDSRESSISKKENLHKISIIETEKAKEPDTALLARYPSKVIFSRFMSMNRPERCLLSIGVIFALASGTVFPGFAIIFANMLDTLSQYNVPGYDYDTRIIFLCYMFLVAAGAAFLFNSVSIAIFSYIGESLAFRIRVALFDKMLHIHMGFFDLPKNSPGNLTTRLSTDTNLVRNLTSSVISIMLQSVSSLVTGISIAFYASWQVTLATLAVMPLTMIAAGAQQKLAQGFASGNDEAYKESGGLFTEAVLNYRTVCSFGNQETLLQAYEKRLEKPWKTAIKKGNLSGLIFGSSQFCIYFVYAVVFFVGLNWFVEFNLSFTRLYLAIFALIFAAFGSGSASAFMPDLGAAQNAGRSILEILDEPILIKNKGNPVMKDCLQGNIEFVNVNFKYPTRDQKIFENLSFSSTANTKIAIVGPSGCGKSTIDQLLLRYYDVDSGEILIDGVNIKDYDIQFLRKNMGVVSQEPVLFNGSIKENISYYYLNVYGKSNLFI